MVYYRIKIFK